MNGDSKVAETNKTAVSKKDRVRRFDFKKKPHKPGFLMPVAKNIISFPDLKKRGAVIRKHDMEDIEGKPYILLVNHASLVDLNQIGRAHV